MKTPAIIAASALAMAIASVGFANAATTTKVTIKPAERCTSLQTQFDAAAPAHKSAKNFAAAQKLRDEGGKLCTAKHYSSGERKILAALKDLGVKAKI